MSAVKFSNAGIFRVGNSLVETRTGPRKRLAQMIRSPGLNPTDQGVEVPSSTTSSNESEIVEGEHKDLSSGAMLPFQYVDKLGVGASAVVEVVEDRTNSRRFAHKFFRPYLGRDRHFKEAFKNEVDIIKRLHSHHHIIQIYWSYTRGREFGMLLTPVASDKDLGAYLLDIHDAGKGPSIKQQWVLYRAFGCLLSGLAYIHRHTIRHKDIKPQNILIHEGHVIYTDFGIAFDANEQSTTTTGMSEAFTRRYCAPEVANNQPRNRKSDVFSLGCVFVEIWAAIYFESGLSLLDPRPYWTRVDEVIDALQNPTFLQDRPDHLISIAAATASVCKKMIAGENELRYTAHDASANLWRNSRLQGFMLYCGDCRTQFSGTQLQTS
jgi:serine/threonine protein kinase